MNISDEYQFPENNTDNELLNETEYVRRKLGPKYLPLDEVLPITLAYIVIFVTGIFGNIVTCIVIRRNPGMQSATNYYLFNLAVSDLLLLILGLPNEISTFWEQYPWKLGWGMCKLRAYASETSSYVSVLTIVAFSLERYIAICHPLRFYASGLKRPVRFIVGAWLVALVCALPFAVYTTVNYIEYPPKSGVYSTESALCAMLPDNIPNFPLYELSCIIFFLAPMMLIVVLYVRMGLRIQSNSLERNIEGSVHGETTQAQSRKAIIRMLGAVVITFFIGWAPFHAQRLICVYEISAFDDINEWLFPLGGCLYYFTTTANPILYNVMSVKYREAFKETLCGSAGSPSISKEEHSSTRESMVCGPRSRKGSQVVRVKSVNYQRSVKYNPTGNTNEVLSVSVTPERGPTNKADTNDSKVIGESLLSDRKKSSFVVHTSNGRPRCQTTSDKDGTPSSETHI